MAKCDFCGEKSIDICQYCGRNFCDEDGADGICNECTDEKDEGEADEAEEKHPDLGQT